MSDAGWAKPRSIEDRAHWWRPDGRRACDPENTMSYSGPKLDDVQVSQACPRCVVLVAEARELLGGGDE